MKRLPKPDLKPEVVYAACIDGLSDATLSQRFKKIAATMSAQHVYYDTLAQTERLHEFVAHDWGKREQIVIPDIRKGEFVDLYDKCMVEKNKPGRDYYDKIMMSAPRKICPYCCIGHVSTLDHFLSKSYYSSLSTLPANLIPACKDCNTGKGANKLSADNQVPHPYFETDAIERDVWLQARIVPQKMPIADYSVAIPAHWPQPLGKRVENYFRDLDLGERFSVQAAAELERMARYLNQLKSQDDRIEHLRRQFVAEDDRARNSWTAPLYRAAANDPWFYSTGFTRLL